MVTDAPEANTAPRQLMPLCEKIGRNKVEEVVHAFYAKARVHQSLGPFFDGVEDFDAHERHISDFWWMAMGGRTENRRSVDMIRRHHVLNLNPQAFTDWLALFRETLHEHLPADLADKWYQMAAAIANNMERFLKV